MSAGFRPVPGTRWALMRDSLQLFNILEPCVPPLAGVSFLGSSSSGKLKSMQTVVRKEQKEGDVSLRAGGCWGGAQGSCLRKRHAVEHPPKSSLPLRLTAWGLRLLF